MKAFEKVADMKEQEMKLEIAANRQKIEEFQNIIVNQNKIIKDMTLAVHPTSLPNFSPLSEMSK